MYSRPMSSSIGFFIGQKKRKAPDSFMHEEEPSSKRNKSADIILVKKRSADGNFVTIYANKKGRIRATITKNGTTRSAFFVKGMNSKIDISNAELVNWTRNTLSNDSYLTVSQGNVCVNVRVLGGGLKNFCGAVFGLAQVGFGIALTVGTGGLAAVAGGGLISSGLSGTSYSLTTDEEKMNFGDYAKQSAIGGVSGAVTGGFSTFGTSAGLLTKAAVSFGGGAAGRIAGAATEAVAYDREIDLTFSSVLASGVSGAVGSTIGAGTSSVSDGLIKEVSETALEGAILGGTCGAVGGAASGAVTQVISNVVQGKEDKTEGIGQAFWTGAAMGAVTGSVSGGKKGSDEQKRRILEQKIPPRQPIVLKGGDVIANLGDKSIQATREHFETAAKYGSVDCATGKPIPLEILNRLLANHSQNDLLGELDLPESKDSPAPFFSSTQNKLPELLNKLGVSPTSREGKIISAIVDNIENYKASRNDFDELSKQLGHINAERGQELTDPKHIIGGGRITAHGEAKINASGSSGTVTDLEGNNPLLSLRNKLYSHLTALSETGDPIKQRCLTKAVIQEVNAYGDCFRYYKGQNTQTLANDIATRIANLAKGDSYLVLTGYDKHAIYHKFTSQNGKIVTTIYNGGGGAGYHQKAGNSSVYPFTFEPISQKDTARLSTYLNQLLENRSQPHNRALPAMYRTNLFKPSNPTNNLPTPLQKVGNCSWHNLTEALSDNFKTSQGDFNQEFTSHEQDICLRLRVERQGLNYENYLNEAESQSSGMRPR